MLRIIDSQSTGKTKQLLAYAKENNCTVICLMPLRMKDKAIRYGLGDISCISYYEFLNLYTEGAIIGGDFVIDEPEMLLSLMFMGKAKLHGYDMTIERE